MLPQQEIIETVINDGIGQIYYLLPLPFISLVVAISIWLGFTKIDGTFVKGYKIYNIFSALILAAVIYFFVPVDKQVVNDIPTLIISVVFSGLFIEIFVFLRKKKTRRK